MEYILQVEMYGRKKRHYYNRNFPELFSTFQNLSRQNNVAI